MLNFVLYHGDTPMGVYQSLEDCAPAVYGVGWCDLTNSQRQHVRYLASSQRRLYAKRKRPSGFIIMPVAVSA